MNVLGLVSVVIPCYNQSHFLGETIESVCEQSYKNYEIIVINDGSTDDTATVAGKFCDVKLIEQKNMGLAAARNTGLRESKGEFVVFLDSDDRLLPNALETGVNALRKYPDCAFVSGFCRRIASDGSVLRFIKQPRIENGADHYQVLLQNCYIWTPANVMFRRSIFEKLSKFNTSINPTADYDLYLRVARQFPVHQHGEIVSEYRQHGASMSSNYLDMLNHILKVFDAQGEYVKNNPNYKKSLKRGIKSYLYLYGKKVISRTFTLLRKKKWKEAIQNGLMLADYLSILSKNIMRILPEAIPAKSKKSSSKDETCSLPEKPLVIIEPSEGWAVLNFIDLWNYRDLLYVLIKRDVQVHYKQTVLGAVWAVIQPLFTMIIFTLFFGKLTGVPSDGLPYPIFAYAGLIPWTFFSNAVTNSGNSLVLNSNLITKVYFPRMVIPIAAVVAGILDLLIAFGFLVLMMIYYRIGLSVNMLMIPVLIVFVSLLAIGIGMLMSALNVKYRDVRYALPFLIQLGLFITPIIYPLSLVPEKWRWLLLINPLAGLIEAFRDACFGRPFDWTSIVISAGVTFFVLIFTAYVFRKMEDSFADII